MKIGVLCSRIRVEEKHIFRALEKRSIAFDKIDVRKLTFDLADSNLADYDAILIRCLSYSRALYAARILQMQGVKAINTYDAIAACGDKVLTTLAFLKNGIPTPHTAVALSEEAALEAIERVDYPVVLKPAVGSWGRLVVKINDRQAAEAVVEYKAALDRAHLTPFYVQDYIDKPGCDIRTMVVGDETVYAIYRKSAHWITNTARGGSVENVAVTPEIDRLSRAAAQAVGGGIVAVDLLETQEGELLVNEVNHTPEFHGAMETVDVDIAGKIVDYVVRVSE